MSREKQIDEMARELAENLAWDEDEILTVDCLETAKRLYNAGYLKQSEGEWIWKSNGYMNALHCSLCNKTAELHHKFCPNCGAHMKGGSE